MRHALILCILVFGCAPTGLPPGGRQVTPVSRQGGISAAPPEAPQLKRLPNGHYRVRKPWTVALDGRVWHVQAGYTSNGMTAPSFIKSSLGDGVEYKETWSAVFHDWLFTQPGISRSEADRMFYDLMIAYGVSSEKAKLMYTTVSTYSLTKSNR
ncbi:MAG: DUF1353 domain-containing protein [Luteolibacter sp.]|uniref:DUF1353 domain-containing protein n=1 Tax=Luteolibacter sp. TaxID=1962973 RepID=UPI003262DFD7